MSGVSDAIAALKAAGFPDSELAVGAAIAGAESNFNPAAVAHESDGSTSYGEWQINSSHGYPELASGAWSSTTVNAQLAKRVYDSQGWNAWSTHKPSDPIGYARYLALLPVALTAVTAMYGPTTGAAAAGGAGISAASGAVGGATDVAQSTLSGVESLIQEPLSIIHWLTQPGTWFRIGKVVIGTAAIIAGIVILARKPIGEGVKAGADVAKVAAVAAA